MTTVEEYIKYCNSIESEYKSELFVERIDVELNDNLNDVSVSYSEDKNARQIVFKRKFEVV